MPLCWQQHLHRAISEKLCFELDCRPASACMSGRKTMGCHCCPSHHCPRAHCGPPPAAAATYRACPWGRLSCSRIRPASPDWRRSTRGYRPFGRNWAGGCHMSRRGANNVGLIQFDCYQPGSAQGRNETLFKFACFMMRYSSLETYISRNA